MQHAEPMTEISNCRNGRILTNECVTKQTPLPESRDSIIVKVSVDLIRLVYAHYMNSLQQVSLLQII